MKINKISALLLFGLLALTACNRYEPQNNPITYGETYLDLVVSTDKAAYRPNETVTFTMKAVPADARVVYSYLGTELETSALSSATWTWTPPSTDYRGYLATIYSGTEVYATIAVDVSSDWAKFPRYGFLSDYGSKTQLQMDKTIERLNRYHINGIQFYDWMADHQRPLAGTVDNPSASWLDLIGRTNYLSTVKGYISAAQSRNIKTMFYNLCYGALKNAAADGVQESWYIFKDQNHSEKDQHPLGSPFRSSIYVTNPANADWQRYLIGRSQDVYDVFGFDGFHIDQLGSRGTVYDYAGAQVSLENTFQPFIEAFKTAQPSKHLVMNAVGGWGQDGIAAAPVDFLYVEVWGGRSNDNPNSDFNDLINTMNSNRDISPDKNIVLAAYMNYDRSNASGSVNKPGVLLANAAIFAWGGSHLELGEHYLTNEYFPNSNLQMKSDLGLALVGYYDFLVAYQNLLRDGGAFQAADVAFNDASIVCNPWPADMGQVASVGKRVDGKDVIHLINFSDANTMNWRDRLGGQKEPATIAAPAVQIAVSGNVSKVWFASPDLAAGAPQTLQFTQSGSQIALTIPSLKYWDMIVIEY